MFPFAFAEIMQIRLPLVVLLEIFCGMFRNEDVTGIAAIHDALGDVDPGAGNVRLLVQIGDFVNRTTVDAHAHPNLGMTLECLGDFLGAKYRCLRVVTESKRAAVTGRQSQQLSFSFSGAVLLGPPHDLAQLLYLSALLVNAQFGIAHDVDEKNMGDLQSDFRFRFVRHRGMNLGGSDKALYINFLPKRE